MEILLDLPPSMANNCMGRNKTWMAHPRYNTGTPTMLQADRNKSKFNTYNNSTTFRKMGNKKKYLICQARQIEHSLI